MSKNIDKVMLQEKDQEEAWKAFSESEEEYLAPEQLQGNVAGMGVGVKWSNGEPTGEPALIVLVTQKLEKGEIRSADMVPEELAGMQTDVLEIGYPMAGGGVPEVGTQTLAERLRPAEGGYSVGHVDITAGTIATGVYDILGEGNGIPSSYYILSNNHVLANSNNARPGDAILQPGPFDGGVDPADRIAFLSRFIPITFEPPVPRAFHQNRVDAAIAKGEFHDIDREIYWIGYVRGWRRRDSVRVGTSVQKTGRTTNYTLGRITVLNATVDVNYNGGRVARFRDQIVTTNMSAPGDSGSLVTTLDNVAIGLLFAGSSQATILNQIEHVRNLLRIEVAEEIM